MTMLKSQGGTEPLKNRTVVKEEVAENVRVSRKLTRSSGQVGRVGYM